MPSMFTEGCPMLSTAPTLASLIIEEISKGVAVSMTTITGDLLAADTLVRSSVCAGVREIEIASWPSPAVYVSVPRARTTVSAPAAIATAAGIPLVELLLGPFIASVVMVLSAWLAMAETKFGHWRAPAKFSHWRAPAKFTH